MRQTATREAHCHHPRLLCDAARLNGVRQRIRQSNPQEWSRISARARELLGARLIPEEEADVDDSQHGKYALPSRQAQEMGFSLGIAYRLTGDARYAEKLREALLHYGGYRRWYGRGLAKRNPPWHSELNTARFCLAYAVGYDFIHDFLSPEDRASIVEALVNLGIVPTLDDWVLPERRIHALDSMGHNWWSVCVGQAGLAALAVLGDDPRAGEWVDAVTRGLRLWFEYKGNVLQNKCANFDERGAFYESVNYANYALAEYLWFHLGYVHTFGRAPDIPLLERVGAFFLHTCYPTNEGLLTVNFGDGRRPAAKACEMLLVNGFADPRLRWYLDRAGERDDVLALLYPDRFPPAAGPDDMPTAVAYPEIGWAMMRTSWADDATLLAVKSGYTWNHAHADAGSFVLYHRGKPLIIDSGNCSYDRPAYRKYYLQSRAHNVILFNGRGQEPDDLERGVKHPGRVHSLIDHAGLRYVYADATGPMSRHFTRNYRHFLWLDDVILVIDDVRSHEEGHFQWLLHYQREAVVQSDGSVLITNGPAEATVRLLFPKELSQAEEVGLADGDPDREVAYLSFSTREKSREAKFITAIFPRGESSDLPGIELLEGQDVLGVRILSAEKTSDVYLNLRADGRRMHVNSNNTVGGWETDAYLVATTVPRNRDGAGARAGAVERLFLAEGSYLRRGPDVFFDSLSKSFVAITPGPRTDVTIRGQERIEAAVRAPQDPERVVVNGQTVQHFYDSNRRLARFAASQQEERL